MPENVPSTTPQYSEWQCPAAACSEDTIIGWLNEATEQGQAWLKSQRGYSDYRKALDTLSGTDSGRASAEYRSRLNTNPLKRDVREVVGAMSKLRPLWGYHSDNSAYRSQAEMMNKVTRAWYLEQFADRSIHEALQYAAATCRGWVFPFYRRDMFGQGRGDIKLFTYGAPCVLPNQLPASGDWQSAYAVTLLEETPVAMAHGMFPAYQHRLTPSNSRYWYMNDGVRKASTGNLLQRIFGLSNRRQPTSEALADLLVPIRRTWVIDLSINTTGQPIPMGEPGASWSYTVPFIGQRIPTGIDPSSGSPTFRIANENDCRLYPYRRLIISSDRVRLYDGPAFDWHGMFPGVAFTMDSWPWEPLGFSLVHDGYEINESIKEIVRGCMDKTRASLDPSLAFDTNAVAMAEARSFDPMKPRERIGFDGSALEGPPFHPAMPPESLKIEPETMTFLQYLETALHQQLAVTDVMALAKMRAVGSMDELEKVMEANGPIVEDMSRAMEPPMRDLGVMLKYLVLQYYTTPRIMQIVGADGVAPEVFDYDPSSLVPSHLVGESPDHASPSSKIIRARTFADNLRFFILPNTLHEMQQMVMKLGLIQLKKSGVKIDSQTIAEAWAVANYGNIDGSTVLEKFQAEQEMDLVQAARMKAIAGAEGLLPTAPPGAPKPGGGNPEGRPNANTAPPKLEQRDGGTRSTITTSP
jgi:hypothetical protein